MKRPVVAFALLFVFLLLTRLCHSGIVWVEEAYPAAGAIQILYGKLPYRDFWFDKPPLTPILYLLWGATTGFPLRVAGALFAFACCFAAYRLARQLWGPREGIVAASLLAFFLTFDVPSAMMALAPDLVMLLPHLVAVYLAASGRPVTSGAVAGIALFVNPKAMFVLLTCLLWGSIMQVIAGFAAVALAQLAILAGAGALRGYYDQVWAWGSIYSRDTFVDQPIVEGVRRTAAWVGFHAGLLLPALWAWRHSKRLTAWALIATVGVMLGWRFFPRYYFLLLPAVVIAASRGWTLMPARARMLASVLLLIPMIRFGPRYFTLASDLVRGRETQWADLAMNNDSRAAAALLQHNKHDGDSLLVWGYRPDIFMYTRMSAGSPFLDSQPLTGVIADRHLTQSTVSAPELAASNRHRLTGYRPTYIVDGLGPYNPRLAITNYRDLSTWLANYEQFATTNQSVLYRLKR